MIFYFSGTGNSLYVAKKIAEASNERIISIAAAMRDGSFEYVLSKDERIGFVFPVYAWAPPKLVSEFIAGLKINPQNSHFLFAIATCGGNIGNTMKVVQKNLSNAGLQLDSGFSLVMPNNYNIMGDVDTKHNESKKLEETEKRLIKFGQLIKERKTGIFELDKGLLPFLQTSIVNPMFMKHAIQPEKFYTIDSCNSCGICAKVCNCSNIVVEAKGKPSWGSNCVQCLACMHYCPVSAIQYGKGTEKKGRYTNPNINAVEMFLR